MDARKRLQQIRRQKLRRKEMSDTRLVHDLRQVLTRNKSPQLVSAKKSIHQRIGATQGNERQRLSLTKSNSRQGIGLITEHIRQGMRSQMNASERSRFAVTTQGANNIPRVTIKNSAASNLVVKQASGREERIKINVARIKDTGTTNQLLSGRYRQPLNNGAGSRVGSSFSNKSLQKSTEEYQPILTKVTIKNDTAKSLNKPVPERRERLMVVSRMKEPELNTQVMNQTLRRPLSNVILGHIGSVPFVNQSQQRTQMEEYQTSSAKVSIQSDAASTLSKRRLDRRERIRQNVLQMNDHESIDQIMIEPYHQPVTNIIMGQVGSIPFTNQTQPKIQMHEYQPTKLSASVCVSNLIPNISEADVCELFGDIGRIGNLRMVNPTTAVVTYVNSADAVKACQTYHNRLLDGLPMQCSIIPKLSDVTNYNEDAGNEYKRATTANVQTVNVREQLQQTFTPVYYLQPKAGQDVQFTVKI